MFLRKRGMLVLAALLMVVGGLFAGGNKDTAPKPEASGQLRIAMLMPGPINDGGWNTLAYTALMEAQKTFGAEVAYTENVKQNDQVQLLRQYASRGFTVMIGHGSEFGDALSQVGEEFPDKYFINYGGNIHNGKNVGSFDFTRGQTGAFFGVLIGMDKNIKKYGVLSSIEQPTTMQEFLNTERYAKKYNPAIQVVYSFTGDWDDIAKGKEAAYALINNGCDLILNDLSGPAGAVVQAVKEHGVKFMQNTFDGYDLSPDNIVASFIQDSTKATLAGLQLIKDGKFEGKVYRFGLAEGAIYAGKYGPSVTDAMTAELEKVKNDFINGKGDLLIIIPDYQE
jgi:basic membrane protein A